MRTNGRYAQGRCYRATVGEGNLIRIRRKRSNTGKCYVVEVGGWGRTVYGDRRWSPFYEWQFPFTQRGRADAEACMARYTTGEVVEGD